MFEREPFRLIEVTTMSPKRYPTGVGCDYEALRVLALALLREIDDPARDARSHGKGNLNLAEEVKRFESTLIQSALIQTGGRQRAAARLLGMKTSTLNAKIKRYKIASVETADRRPSLNCRKECNHTGGVRRHSLGLESSSYLNESPHIPRKTDHGDNEAEQGANHHRSGA